MLQQDDSGMAVTKHQIAQKQSEQRFRPAFESAAVGVAYTDLQGRFIQVNSTYCAITGYSAEELMTMDFLTITHPEDREANWKLREKMLDGEIPAFVFEKRYLKKDGSIFWGQASVSLVRDQEGAPLYSVAIIEDITARKQAEQLIQRQAALLEVTSDAIILWKYQGEIVYWNRGAERFYGFTRQEALGRQTHDLLRTRHNVPWQQILDTLSKTGRWEGELIHTTKDGRPVNVACRKVLVTEEDGTLLIMETNQDITGRKRTQERQQVLDRASEKLIASLNYQVTLPEIAQMIVPALADYCRIALLDEQQQIKDIVAHHIDPQKIVLVQELYAQYKDRVRSTSGIQNLLETGKPELISHVNEEVLEPISQENPGVAAIVRALGLRSYMGTPLIARGRIIGALTFSSTQPYRHYTQDDLFFAQELSRRIAFTLDNAYHYLQAQEAISLRDDFLSMASHELKTPLTSLKIYTQIVQRQLARKGEEDLGHSLAKMDAQLNKLTLLIGDLLNVSRIEHGQLALQMDAFDINELVREMVAQVQLIATSHTVRVEGRITRSVWGDRDRIAQVILNLLSNAIKYSPGANTVIVHLTPEQDHADVSVQDFGIGIDSEHLNKIFLRFYRVSGSEEKTFPGLGIGLYLSQEILKRHGSNMTVESEKGNGSLFRFTLPYNSTAL